MPILCPVSTIAVRSQIYFTNTDFLANSLHQGSINFLKVRRWEAFKARHWTSTVPPPSSTNHHYLARRTLNNPEIKVEPSKLFKDHIRLTRIQKMSAQKMSALVLFRATRIAAIINMIRAAVQPILALVSGLFFDEGSGSPLSKARAQRRHRYLPTACGPRRRRHGSDC